MPISAKFVSAPFALRPEERRGLERVPPQQPAESRASRRDVRGRCALWRKHQARGGHVAAVCCAPRRCANACRVAGADSSSGNRSGGSVTADGYRTGAVAAHAVQAGDGPCTEVGCDIIERIAELIRRTHSPERATGPAGEGGRTEAVGGNDVASGGTAVQGEGGAEGARAAGGASAPAHAMRGEEPLRVLQPLLALDAGRWVKLICGASFEDVADVRNLAFVYTLAGVDCIDCAAEPAVVAAAAEGIDAAMAWAAGEGRGGGEWGEMGRRPWVMVSVSDGRDPHFRKAVFDASLCPPACPRPCERVCPAAAIRFHAAAATSDAATSTGSSADSVGGVIADRCYGCGRCIPVCPFGIISAEEHQRTHEDTLTLLGGGLVDAIEIHTLPGHVEAFNALWASIGEAAGSLKLVAVSLPDLGGAMHHAMHAMYRTMHPHLSAANLWQLDGRPMSGDIGAGATRATIRLAARVAAFEDRPPGYLQIAGGTNSHTFTSLQDHGMLPSASSDHRLAVAGVAFGGHARKVSMTQGHPGSSPWPS
ncbi:hypothetical protein CLOM_g17968 [Closterium sp. NIES-68]|nr:hypothetical protein CLOM_g17968 [Closterium sp. NIES-68]GJP67737.1 hypothetical protein CLOP_g24519 [Closterium sp. NIES-67]